MFFSYVILIIRGVYEKEVILFINLFLSFILIIFLIGVNNIINYDINDSEMLSINLQYNNNSYCFIGNSLKYVKWVKVKNKK